jgi:hypothetical protein
MHSPRRRVYHCLASPKGFLVDHSNQLIGDQSPLWTDDANLSLRFLVQDLAAERVRRLRPIHPDLTLRLVSFAYASPGIWLATDE